MFDDFKYWLSDKWTDFKWWFEDLSIKKKAIFVIVIVVIVASIFNG